MLYWSHKERTRRRESAAPEIVKNGGDPYGSIDCILHRLPVSCGTSLTEKLRRLCIAAGIKSIDMDGKFVAIKMHFGELGNLAFLRPNYAR